MGILSEFQELGAYAFHRTPSDNTTSIGTDGLRTDTEAAPDSVMIADVLDDLRYNDPFPFDREDAIYFHVNADYVENTIMSASESELYSSDSIIVVAVEEINAPMYVADMSVVTDLIDYQVGGTDMMMYADTPDEAVAKYRDSITRVKSPSEVASAMKKVNHAELIITDNVSKEAIESIFTICEESLL